MSKKIKNDGAKLWAVRQPFNPTLNTNGKKARCKYREYNAKTGESRQRLKQFGSADDPAAWDKFETWKAKHQAQPRTAADSLAGVLVAWVKYCREIYHDPRELNYYCELLVRLLRPYQAMAAGQIRSSHIKHIRDELVREAIETDNRSRPYINKIINSLGDLFQWAAEENLVDDSLAATVQKIKPLTRKTAPGLRGKKTVVAAPADPVGKAIDAANPTVAALLAIHRLTGMRPKELATMSWQAIDTDRDVWKYYPANKNDWRDGEHFARYVFLGSRAQAILHEYQASRPDPGGEFIFSPREAWALTEERKNDKRLEGKDLTALDEFNQGEITRAEALLRLGVYHSTLRSWVQTDPREKNSLYFFHRAPAKYKPYYDRYSLRTAYHNAAKAAGVESFNPRQIRKLKALEIDETEGREAVAAQLGHARVETSAIYTGRNQAKALELARRFG